MNVKSAVDHAASILKVGRNRIWVSPDELQSIKEAITKDDVRELIKNGALRKRPAPGQSRARARRLLEKKRKGRRGGPGSRKGTKTARRKKKRAWVGQMRAQRATLQRLREKDEEAVQAAGYSKLYRMIKGNYFRGKKYVVRRVEEAVGRKVKA